MGCFDLAPDLYINWDLSKIENPVDKSLRRTESVNDASFDKAIAAYGLNHLYGEPNR